MEVVKYIRCPKCDSKIMLSGGENERRKFTSISMNTPTCSKCYTPYRIALTTVGELKITIEEL